MINQHLLMEINVITFDHEEMKIDVIQLVKMNDNNHRLSIHREIKKIIYTIIHQNINE